jgi:dynein heavy chain, axonemal
MWTEETIRAFDELDGGSETAMREHSVQIVGRIKDLINCVRRELTMDLRVKIITIITIDVHGRDIIEDYVVKKITDSGVFAWAS